MDYQNDINKVTWEWLGESEHLKKGSNHNMDKCMLNGMTVNQNGEDMSFMFQNSTPVKACGDLAYQYDNSDIMVATPEECEEYIPQAKRRRLLDFDDEADDISSSFLESKETIDSFDDIDIPDLSQWEACLQENLYFEDLAKAEDWLADCLVDLDTNIISDEGNATVASDVHIAVKDCTVTPHTEPVMPQRPVKSSRNILKDCNVGPHPEPVMAQKPVRSSQNIILKGRKSYMRTPIKATSSVAYPFNFIKPCGVLGEITLKDINQRILTPPPAKPKPKEEPEYPTSAFSGKPVVGKTKIPTQGGRGSITIMRTKG